VATRATRYPGERPRVAAVARWQALRRETVANLRHEAVRLTDPFARALLPLCDGTRNRDDLARALAGARDAGDPSLRERIDDALAGFARLALLEPA
jgi:hypothetical protein